MSYTNAEARQELLDQLGHATDVIALAVACLGAAYEALDEQTADELERSLFAPVQLAYGRAQRTHGEFADRYGLPRRTFQPRSAGVESQGPRDLIQKAVDATGEADHAIAELQDSMLPVEVGDRELRAGLTEVRELINGIPARARALLRTVGR
jgi:hypothetical protein